jgi:hypothetical protein
VCGRTIKLHHTKQRVHNYTIQPPHEYLLPSASAIKLRFSSRTHSSQTPQLITHSQALQYVFLRLLHIKEHHAKITDSRGGDDFLLSVKCKREQRELRVVFCEIYHEFHGCLLPRQALSIIAKHN